MQNIEALKELLRMAHEQLDSQKAENDGLKVRIAELEKEKETLTQHHGMWKDLWHELHSGLPIRDLEQQAKGVSDFVSSIEGFSEGYIQALKEAK
jgi:hypothetical protein